MWQTFWKDNSNTLKCHMWDKKKIKKKKELFVSFGSMFLCFFQFKCLFFSFCLIFQEFSDLKEKRTLYSLWFNVSKLFYSHIYKIFAFSFTIFTSWTSTPLYRRAHIPSYHIISNTAIQKTVSLTFNPSKTPTTL